MFSIGRQARQGVVLGMAALAVLCGCDASNQKTPANDKLRVIVSIQPLTYFVKQIGGAHVSVEALLLPGQSHGAFDPTARQMASLSGARAFIRTGVAFEQAVIGKLSGTQMKIVDVRDGIELRHLEAHGHDEHAHESHAGHDHDHEHEGHVCGENELDPHIWLDPVLVKKQAQTICDAFVALDPGHAEDYRSNLSAFIADLDRMDAEIRGRLARYAGRAIVVFHPSFGYLCERYGLKQLVIETAGKEPGPRQLSELIAAARETGAKVVFSQVEYSAAGAQAVAEAIGAKVVRVAPQSADWKENLLSMIAAIDAALAAGGV